MRLLQLPDGRGCVARGTLRSNLGGVPIDERMRRICKDAESCLRTDIDPFTDEGEEYFCQALLSPLPCYPSLLPAVLHHIRAERPDLQATYPNADVKPEWLAQFALMGSIYAEIALGRQRPSVATLSNGEEEGKGNAVLVEAVPLIRALPLNYVGNVEGNDVTAGRVDVVVVDGFAGNIFLKGAEGTVATMTELIRKELTRNPLRALLALGLRPAFRSIRRRLSYEEVGGVPLLGVNGVCIVAHGRSTPYAIQNAIRAGAQCVELRLVERIRDRLGALHAQHNL